MACHNLLSNLPLPAGTARLLGLGLNYCLKHPSITHTTQETYNRLIGDLRRMYALRNAGESDEYIPSLYIKSNYRFKAASDEIEEAAENFRDAITSEQLLRSRKKKPSRNLSHRQLDLVRFFKDNDQYIVVQGDKNLGPCILDRKEYILRGFKEHLGNERNYRLLSAATANTLQIGFLYRFDSWLGRYRPRLPKESLVDYVCIGDAEETFLLRARQRDPRKFARFRMTAKVHKQPWMTRPIVCCSGTFAKDWSKWLDYWFQKLKFSVPTFVKDSQQVLDEVKLLNLPPQAKLFTCDANAMYNNINTDHAVQVITWWLRDLESTNQLPPDFPLDAVLDAMVIIMKNNIFEFGTCYFLQLVGTAMGTSAAVMWATLYFAYHEVHTLIPNHGQFLFYFKRFIDDMFGIWIGNTTNHWSAFCNDVNNFGELTWDIFDQKLSSSVDFLDLTLIIRGNKIVSRTFQKKMNLYLYIPPTSAHPAGCIKGTVFGLIRRYYAQNTFQRDFVHFVKLLYRRLLLRGWDRTFMRNLILEACTCAKSKAHTPAAQPTLNQGLLNDVDRLFIHIEYHPEDIPRKRVQELYQLHLGEVLNAELGIEQPTIAYSRPKNIGDLITKAKLHQASGQTSSIILGEYRDGLAPP
ncbi:hypothetical protein ACHAWO_010636 [Cyclotella atomus]|uniref:RNA-dependent RNA polymerase n=1 Tax=Cyclotella atomus TaxID=382360 RepID=A0ABD3PR03_9STRA